jgi:mannose-1-phosphate guanylyltransferase
VNRDLLGKKKGVLRLEQDVFVPLTGTKRLYVYQYNGFWRQIKHAGASVYCNDLYTKHFANVKPHILAKQSENIIGNVIIHPTAQIGPSCRIGPDVTIGANVKIGSGVRISHSIILDGAEIKDHACISYSILGWDSIIGQWTRVEGIPNYTPFLYNADKRQGITIFGKGAVAEREIIVRNCILMPQKVLDHSYFNEILL